MSGSAVALGAGLGVGASGVIDAPPQEASVIAAVTRIAKGLTRPPTKAVLGPTLDGAPSEQAYRCLGEKAMASG